MTETSPEKSGIGFGFFLPLGVFAIIAILFFVVMKKNEKNDPSDLPSVLIGKPVPQFNLPGIENLTQDGKPVPGFSHTDLATGTPTILLVWASYCIPCAEEQPLLTALKAEYKFRIFGLNYKDKPDAAREFLANYSNPFDAIGVDRSGRVSIDWGVAAVPEMYVIDGKGIITYKHNGALTREVFKNNVLPILTKK
jgi:cytochrome c biogenesis protein CcmG, thiol:disulfide interchange protein DsbE